jgi:DNA-binding MarR family transcriptional regulator
VLEVRRFIANTVLFNQRLADALGINATDYQVLNVLDLRGSARPGELAKLTGLTTGGVTVVLDRLERAGFVRRERNPNENANDPRAVQTRDGRNGAGGVRV